MSDCPMRPRTGAGRCGKLAADDAQLHPSASTAERTRRQTNVRCGPLCGIETPDLDSGRCGTTRAWPIFDPSHFVRCVRCVRDPAQNGRSGRGRTHMARAYEVEGLVLCKRGGGSSPLGRIKEPESDHRGVRLRERDGPRSFIVQPRRSRFGRCRRRRAGAARDRLLPSGCQW
jgi:hypothetical protein